MIPSHRFSTSTLAVCVIVLALTGCRDKPSADGEASAPEATAATATPERPVAPDNRQTAVDPADSPPDNVMTETPQPSAPLAAGATKIVGIFRGTVPCADCAGIDTTLDLGAGGSYTLHETYRDRDVKPRIGGGTWTTEAGGKRLRLDPVGKTDVDRLYGILSGDELVMLDEDGDPPDSTLDYSLKREASASK